MPKRNAHSGPPQLPDDPLWYKDGIIYEVHVRAFSDTDADGIGDFRGLTEKLDYLRDLGVSAVWLLPFYPSPLRDDGYDIADYTNIHPAYGTLADFKTFLREAHRRGLRVITELVVNHTSDQHPWFQRARRARPGSREREFYVWSDTPDKYRDARIIFKDFEPSNWSWDALAKAYYWHRFYSHQPDLNYDNPEVHKAVMRALDFWLEMGVDGLRLDAVPYLYEREATNCENLPETHRFLKQLRAHVDRHYRNRLLLAEANQWPEDAVAYFGDGDECHMAFHFPVMPRLFMAIRMEDRFPIIDILEQTPPIPDTAQWALFLRNHDELTLEMVTDEERDYMYRVYARDPQAKINLGIRRRLAPLLGNDRRRIELMNALLFSLPGTPVIYYGDEVGMGENIYLGDRNGVRTPMQWSADRNAGFSRANPQKLYLPIVIDPEYHYEALNVEAQLNNPHSLLWWMRRLVALRKRHKAFGRGTLEFLHPANRKVLVFVRSHENERILAVANLSRFVQHVELDLARYRGMIPIELFGRNRFPPIGELPYFLTLSPHSFYWFALQPERVTAPAAPTDAAAPALAALTAPGTDWESALTGKTRAAFEEALAGYMPLRRWFGAKSRAIKSLEIREAIPVPYLDAGNARATGQILLAQVEFIEGDPQTYVLAVVFETGERAEQIAHDLPHTVIARLELAGNGARGLLCDGTVNREFCNALLETIGRRRTLKGRQGELVASTTHAFKTAAAGASLEPAMMKAEQSNTSVIYGDRLILKLFRRVEPGINPDLEIGRFLTARRFPAIPAVAGALEYQRKKDDPISLAILQVFVPGAGDAWKHSLDALGRYFERVLALPAEARAVSPPAAHLLDCLDQPLPATVPEMIGTYLESARLLGQRTAELHLALAAAPDDPNFAPEPFTALYQRSIYQSLRSLAGQNLALLRQQLPALPEPARADADAVLHREPDLLKRYRALLDRRVTGLRIRIHGDFHLGQVLHTGKDFIIIDFEGEPARSLSERRIKRMPLRDVAGMLRSFHYASHAALRELRSRGMIGTPDIETLEPWARFWHHWVSVVYLHAYRDAAGEGGFLPKSAAELRVLLDAFLLDKAIYELGYELNNRPGWVRIPLRGILALLDQPDRVAPTVNSKQQETSS
jgi:maltose alpha-D-glucosyltransferase/alpha-amylase